MIKGIITTGDPVVNSADPPDAIMAIRVCKICFDLAIRLNMTPTCMQPSPRRFRWHLRGSLETPQ